MQTKLTRIILCTAIGAGTWLGQPNQASACGGFFCSLSAPVNQAAERIVFANDGQGTVTAVIQIMYEGPSEKFSWLLPSPSVPDEVLVSSDLAFQRLQAATNPSYSLTTRVEGTCKIEDDVLLGGDPSVGIDTDGDGIIDGFDSNGDGVVVEASGVVGAFQWEVISVDDSLDDPTDAAVNWLEANGYDVTPEGADLLAPYLDEGMYLVALKLVKGASVGSIRPIVLKYASDEPMIPIQLTAVAANDDMGVMAWLLGEERGVPKNYLSLELNEAQINWFNAASNYNDVVVSAAKEAGGQGFVTEFAGASDTLDGVIWTDYDEQNWSVVSQTSWSSFDQVWQNTYFIYAGLDGFWDAVRATVTPPDGVSFEDFQSCPTCYSADIDTDPADYVAALDEHVIAPMQLMQDLFDEYSYTTRIYTTMSASDMTLDPVFTYNPDLGDVSNLHTAERVIECSPSLYQFEAPWRIELPQGGVIRGTADDANNGVWPNAVKQQPANLVVSQLSDSGDGQILVDNSDEVEASLKRYNDSLDLPGRPERSPGCSMAGGRKNPPVAALGLVLGLAFAASTRRSRRHAR